MNLFSAFNQWATRPADERFWTLDDLFKLTTRFHHEAVEAQAEIGDLKVLARDDEVFLRGADSEAGFTHYSFGQICQTAGAPAKYLRGLPAELAAKNVNHGLHRVTLEGRRPRHILMRQNGGLRAHAIVSPDYGRIWNDAITERLIDLQGQGWRVPPARPAGAHPDARPATEADVLSTMQHGFLSINVGDMIAPAGIYASDRDMFVFMISEHAIEVPGLPPLYRGFFVQNSEVGDRSFKVTTFLFSHVCGNHIVWDVKDVVEVKVIHYGDEQAVTERAFAQMADVLDGYLHSDTTEDTDLIEAALTTRIGENKQDTIDRVYSKMHRSLPIRRLDIAYDLAEAHPEDGHLGPDTVWGMVQGITRLSQQSEFAG